MKLSGINRKHSYLLVFFFFILCSLTACGNKYRKAEQKDAIQYFEKRYEIEIESISETKTARNQRECLDTSGIPYSNDAFNHDKRDNEDIIYTLQDKNGICFHMVQMYQYGWTGYYKITEDYLVQLLRSRPSLYEKLETSPYQCQYVNTIGADDIPYAGFQLYINNFEEITPATTLAYETIMNEDAILTDTETIPEDLSVHSIVPEIFIIAEKTTLDRFRFRTAKDAKRPDLQECIRYLEREYVQNVRDGVIKEKLSTDLLNLYGPEKISDISYNGDKIPNFQIYYGMDRVLETNWDCYIIWDKSKKTEKCDIYYDVLNHVLNTVGFHMTCDRHSITWSNDKHSVTISQKGKERICTHNGKEYQPEGILSPYLLKFTEKDVQELFGMQYKINKVAETAEIILE